MESKLQSILHINVDVREQIIYMTCQTLLYGIYLCLAPITIHAMVTNGLQSRARKWLLAIITSMFALMTVYWIVSVVFTFLQADSWNNIIMGCFGSDSALFCVAREVKTSRVLVPTSVWQGVTENILFINYLITDGVVVWRAWVLCSDQSRIVLMIPVATLGINTVIYLMMVAANAMQIVSLSKHEFKIFLILTRINTITQVAHLTLSLLINIFATSLIALKAWKYRKLLMESGIGIRTPGQAIRILAILVESGMIYILIGVTSVVCFFIFARFGNGDAATLVALMGIQLSTIYPIVVVLLVEKNRSLNTTFSSFGTIKDVGGDRPSQAEPMVFASVSVLASGEGTDSVPKSRHTIISSNVTFDHMLELGGAGMGTGNNSKA